MFARAPEWLLHTAIGGGLLLLLVALAFRLVRSPARQQRLGEWGVAAALLLSLLSLGPAWITVPVRRPTPPPAPIVASTPTPSEGHQGWDEVVEEGNFAIVEQAEMPGELVTPTPDAPAVAEHPPAPTPGWKFSVAALTEWVVVVYFIGAAFFLGRWLLGLIGLAWLLGGGAPVPWRVRALLDELASGRRVHLVISPRAQVPFSFGLFRPTVVLPIGLANAAPLSVLRWALGHELAHLERRDAWGTLLLGLGQVVYWFVPWYGYLIRRVRLCQEYLADATAAGLGGSPADYAEFLVHYAAGPTAPALASGVSGASSDLFRRINMLLDPKKVLEGACPRRWLTGMICGLLSLAVLGAGVGLRVYADDPARVEKKANEKKEEPKKEEPAKPAEKKEEPKKRLPGLFPDLDDVFKNLPPGAFDPAQMKEFKEQMEMFRKEMDRAMKALEGGRPGLFPNVPGRLLGRTTAMDQPKLGARLDKPGATLADQLDLPKDQGMVLEDIVANSPASKAGLKKHDILLELGGKPVPSKEGEFLDLLSGLKANTEIEAVVLRKGKRETIKGLKLADVKVEKPGRLPGLMPGLPGLPGGGLPGGGIPGFPALPGLGLPKGAAPNGGLGGGLGLPGLGGKGLSISRSGDQFVARQTDGDVKITVKGTVSKGKAEVGEVRIEENGKESTYEGLDKVPAEYKEKVQKLAEMSVGGRPRLLQPNKL